MLRTAILGLVLSASSALALQLELPAGARETAARDSALAQIALPTAPFGAGGLTTDTIEGPVARRAYRIGSEALTPLQLIAPLREQIIAAGYQVALDCDQSSCGGFDFRFALEVLPAPNMYVNIRAYHFLAARHADSGAAVMVLASTAQSAAYIQIITVGASGGLETVAARAGSDTPLPDSAATPDTSPQTDFIDTLLRTGAAVMHSIDFAVGTTTLSDGPSPEMAELAALLEARPGLQVAVVGHTDTGGGLDANIAVSQARATAVRDRLIAAYGVDPDRIEAAGMGYLAPRASNLTQAGRDANRRVEVIVVREGE